MWKSLLFFLLSITVLSSCKKDPGEGGKGTIKGYLYSKSIYNPDQQIQSDDVQADHKVYISYGDNNEGFDDNVETSHDGSFEFRFLREGNYTLYAYSYNENSGLYPVQKIVTIPDYDATVEVKDFVVSVEPDMGSSSIKGVLWVKDYSMENELKAEFPGYDEDVYISFGNSSLTNNMKTSSDGSFEFKNLKKGKYKVFAYSERLEDKEIDDPVIVDVEITENNKVYNISNIIVNR